MKLPAIEAAGGEAAAYAEVMMPLSLDVPDRCYAPLSLAGVKRWADDEMDRFSADTKPQSPRCGRATRRGRTTRCGRAA